ncbi:prepilin-type N-terminal cleavage/methylation domain-containing protein [Pseudoalteromonas piscicida]|nr:MULTISPECIES: type II secretion system protein [Pseudoalteromonas]QUI69707.1 prepilin-type N-terminal cleavage/methylation domain-containing protein [Pseudoalteromonas sp. M8]UDM62810.1 prepilin-type N-terminal cleavage/methylation domain-containing protein [Pseudoalteromonas piscicida]
MKEKFRLLRYSKHITKVKGFTLIEVLIAAIILFSSIALVSQLFKSALVFSSKAAEVAQFYQLAPSLVTSIKSELRLVASTKEANYEGKVELLGERFNWQARRILFNNEQGREDFFKKNQRFAVYNVMVTGSKANEQFEFEVATW